MNLSLTSFPKSVKDLKYRAEPRKNESTLFGRNNSNISTFYPFLLTDAHCGFQFFYWIFSIEFGKKKMVTSSYFLLTCTAARCGFLGIEETKLVFSESRNKTNCGLENLTNTCFFVFLSLFLTKCIFLYKWKLMNITKVIIVWKFNF